MGDDRKDTPEPLRRKGRVDEGSEDSFPASDPPSHNPGTPGAPPGRKDKGEDE